MLEDHSNVRILWVGGGTFSFGEWDGKYDDQLGDMLDEHPNLHISITPEALSSPALKQAQWAALCEVGRCGITHTPKLTVKMT